jgi:hypothetical protein
MKVDFKPFFDRMRFRFSPAGRKDAVEDVELRLMYASDWLNGTARKTAKKWNEQDLKTKIALGAAGAAVLTGAIVPAAIAATNDPPPPPDTGHVLVVDRPANPLDAGKITLPAPPAAEAPKVEAPKVEAPPPPPPPPPRESFVNRDVRSYYVAQPNGFECSNYSTLMALRAVGLNPPIEKVRDITTVNQYNGTGLPGNGAFLANRINASGLPVRATFDPSPHARDILEAVKQGYVVIVNGSTYSANGGHFFTVVDVTKDGHAVVGDPFRGDVDALGFVWTKDQLDWMSKHGDHPRGFVKLERA